MIKINKYGNYFALTRKGIWLMINGFMMSFYKHEKSKKWTFSTWENIWRKSGEQIPHYNFTNYQK